MKKLPLYRVKLKNDDKTAVYAVSLVDSPAIEVDWLKLSEELQMSFASQEDKQMLYGPLLIPGKLIFRRDEKTGEEFNIVFEAETIAEISQRYNKSKINDIFNINHSGTPVEAYLAENWLTKTPDASNSYGFDLPEGTWFGGVKVEDKNFWMSEVKSENVKGFSVEINCGIELMEFSKQENEIYELESYDDYPQAARDKAQKAIDYKEKNGSTCGTAVGWTRARQLANGDKISEDTINRMSAFQRHKQYKDVPYDEGCGGIMWDAWGGDEGIAWAERKSAQLRKLSKQISIEEKNSNDELDKYKNKTINLMEVKTKDGIVYKVESLELDMPIVEVAADGTESPVNDGEYTLEDGTEITVTGSVLSEVSKPEEESTDIEEDMETKLALDPIEVMSVIQPALDEFRSIIADLMTRIDTLENKDQESVDSTQLSATIQELNDRVETLAMSAGAQSITVKNDKDVKPSKTNKDERMAERIQLFKQK